MRSASILLICVLLAGCAATETVQSAADAASPKPEVSSAGEFGPGLPGSIGIAAGSRMVPDKSALRLTVEPDTTEPAATRRIVIYSGSIRLVVADVASTIESIRQMALGMGGYLQDMEGTSITIRVPAAKFDEAVAAVQRKGEVSDKQIKAADVTEELRDLDIRLTNAEQTRQQLLAILAKSDKMDDTLKIEAELERVTEQVELLKGKIRFMQLQVAYSVLRVDLNSRVPQSQLMAAIPFPWVRELGQGVVGGGSPEQAAQSGWFSGGVSFDLPSSYIRYYQQDDLSEAMSADGVMIKAQRHDNYKGGDVKFWGALARRSLLNNGSVAVTRETDANSSAHVIEGTKDLPGGAQGYLLLALQRNDGSTLGC